MHELRTELVNRNQVRDFLLSSTKWTQALPAALALLSAQKCFGGSWSSGMCCTDDSQTLVVIKNGFTSGALRKKTTAIVFGHSFLRDKGKRTIRQLWKGSCNMVLNGIRADVG